MATVLSVNVSEKKGTRKNPVPVLKLKKDVGIVGDAHAGQWHRQVSLLGDESVEKVRAVIPGITPGAFAENINVEGMCLYELPVGTKLRVGSALCEVTQIGKQCHDDGCAIKRATGDCVMPREGIFVIVLEDGEVKTGDLVEIAG